MRIEPKRFTREAGVTITEVLIGLAVAALVAAVALPAAGRITGDARVDGVLDTLHRLESATARHLHDTGGTAVEFSPSPNGGAYGRPRYHQLAMSQDTPGWRGPYLERPLSREDNPLGGVIYLQNQLDAAPAQGFRLQGAGGPLTTGEGQFVVFHDVPEDVADRVDRQLDRELRDDAGDWAASGRVEWTPGGGGSLSIWISTKDERR